MKLPTERRRTSTKSKEALFRETESDELDLKRVILERRYELQKEFEKPPAVGDRSFWLDHAPTLADIIFIDQVFNEQILSPEAKKSRLQQLHQIAVNLKSQPTRNLRNRTSGSLAYGGWVQLFPEERAVVHIDDDDLNKVITQYGMFPTERALLNVTQIRPDKRSEIASHLNVERFERAEWKNRALHLTNPGSLGGFLERLGCVYLIREGSRERFALSPEEKQQLFRIMKELPASQLPSVFRNALIVLMDGTVLKDNGQIEVRVPPRFRGQASALPDRLQM